MNYIFFGTPRFSAIILQKLIDAGMPPALVVCNPDKPMGRKKIITPPPVKELITNSKLQIEILQPETLGSHLFNIRSPKFEVGVVAAYAKIIPKDVIDLFPKGIIGVHPSLLPKYRGPSPIQQVILDGEKETGVSLYLLDEKMDHGKIIATNNLQIATDDTYAKLEEKLSRMAGEMLVGILPRYVEGKIELKEQNHKEATFTKKFTIEDSRVDLTKDAPDVISKKIRALNPEPGAWAMQNGKRLKLLEARMIDGKWVVTKTQLEGKNPKEDKIFLECR